MKMILKRHLNLGFGTVGMRVWAVGKPITTSHCDVCGRFTGEDDLKWSLGKVEVCRCWRHTPESVREEIDKRYDELCRFPVK